MEEKKTIFNFLGSVFCMYGISMALMIVFCRLFGEAAQKISNLFRLGKEGLPIEVMWQFLVISFLITGIRYLLFSENMFTGLSVLFKTVVMILAVVALMAMFICLFGWFPVRMWEPWVMFLLCFGGSFITSMALMRWKTRLENRKLEEGLARMKEKWEEEEDGKRD